MKIQLSSHLKQACNCDITGRHIIRGIYSCGLLNHQIIYRAQILGTANFSAVDLTRILQKWISTGRAYIIVSEFRMALDPDCPTRLDTLDDPECLSITYYSTNYPVSSINTAKYVSSYKTPAVARFVNTDRYQTEKSQEGDRNNNGISGASIAGLFIGSFISILLIVITITTTIAVICWKFSKKSKSTR